MFLGFIFFADRPLFPPPHEGDEAGQEEPEDPLLMERSSKVVDCKGQQVAGRAGGAKDLVTTMPDKQCI